MADSDNSRTLPTVTRGDLHSLVAACFPTYPEVVACQNPGFSRCIDDPAVAAWDQWHAAWQRLGESTVKQQQLEATLFSGVLSASGGQHVSRTYNAALEAEERAALAEDLAAQALWRAPAVSLAGAAAKLDAILNRGQPSPTSPDEPWPQIRVVIAELLRIDKALERLRRLADRDRQPARKNG